MKKKSLKITLIAIISLCYKTQYAQFVLSSEIRPRAEYRDGYKRLMNYDEAPAFFISQRTRLNLLYKAKKVNTLLILQDVRTWGSEKQLVRQQDNGFSVHQAWAEIFIGKSNLSSLKIGRQEINLDDQRIFGATNWAQQARSHDALIFKYTNPKILDIQLGLAYNQNFGALSNTFYSEPGNGSGYKTMQYLWLHKKFLKKELAISLLFLNKGDQVHEDYNANGEIEKGEYWDNYSQTIGTHIEYKKSNFGAKLNTYYQTGKVAEYRENLGPRNINAFNIGIDINYKILKNTTLFVGYEFLSGQSQIDTSANYQNINHSFTPYFGTNHKFNGFMDYFFVGNHINNVGLQDFYLKLKYKKDKFYIGADYHAFLSGAKIKDDDILKTNPATAIDSYLGSEIDLYTGFSISKDVKFNFVYAMMFGAKSMEVIKGGDRKQFNNYAYCEVVMKPVLFDSEKFMKKKLERQIELIGK